MDSCVTSLKSGFLNIFFHFLSFTDGYVVGHYANNARDYLYPAVSPYPGTGREVTLFKTSLFNPIRITVSKDYASLEVY
jgi:hypothetical protein